ILSYSTHRLYTSYIAPISLIYTLSLHDALPILSLMMEQFEPTNEVWRAIGSRKSVDGSNAAGAGQPRQLDCIFTRIPQARIESRSEEHTSELQSRENLVCRLLLEKKE